MSAHILYYFLPLATVVGCNILIVRLIGFLTIGRAALTVMMAIVPLLNIIFAAVMLVLLAMAMTEAKIGSRKIWCRKG